MQNTGIRTNTGSLVTSQLEASERVTHTLEGTRCIDTATSGVTATITHRTFIDVWSGIEEKNKSEIVNFDFFSFFSPSLLPLYSPSSSLSLPYPFTSIFISSFFRNCGYTCTTGSIHTQLEPCPTVTSGCPSFIGAQLVTIVCVHTRDSG